MKKLLILIFLSTPAHALEGDKQIHLLFGTVVGAGGTIVKNRWWGMGLGCSVGLLKEVSDHNGNGVADPKDFYMTCGGAILSAQGVHLLKLRAKRQGVVVEWMKEF